MISDAHVADLDVSICQLIVAHDKASMRNFAQELIDEIIDHTANMKMGATAGLCESPSAQTVAKVGALGLVCKQWWPRSRFHLFSHLILNPRTIQSFFDLVDNSPCPILTFIETLDLQFDHNPALLDEGQLRRFGESCGLKTLWIQVPRLEESNIIQFLSSLQFHAAVLGASVPSISAFAMIFDKIPLGITISVVSSFPSLEILWLSGAEIDVTGGLPKLSPLPLSIHTLKFHMVFFKYLLSLPCPLHLLKLEFDAHHTDPDGAVASYFRLAGGTIQHMQLDVPRLQQGIVSCAQAIIQHTPNLQRLYLAGQVVPILDFMAAISSHKLNVLRIYQLILEDLDDMAENPWRDIDALLASERFLALHLDPQQYHFDFTASSDVRDAMPLSTARGILHGPMTMQYS
ncbi:hypothetical protein B0H14DRAFT_2714381 [Mycena olivaceomarginata]|nr:hypothetical protein B0H14DRAFT_2714381 [Mycena olivaceomarginata]